MKPYVKPNTFFQGSNRPKIDHGKNVRPVTKKTRNEIASVRRSLKKAARREGKKEIDLDL
jgi:hypothetical protein